MKYIHVRNLEKYHPGYKDRTLQWGKIFINMVEGDPDCELIDNETDWGRFIKMILLELRAQKPLPDLDVYWTKKGFNLKKRPMTLTLRMLHSFLDIVTEDKIPCYAEKEEEKRKKKEKEVTIKDESIYPFNSKFMFVKKSFLDSILKVYTYVNLPLEFKKMDGWLLARPKRREGNRNWQKFIVHWLNGIDKPPGRPKVEVKEERPRKVDPVEKAKVSALIHKTAESMGEKKKGG